MGRVFVATLPILPPLIHQFDPIRLIHIRERQIPDRIIRCLPYLSSPIPV